jgi:hypothetical protein
VARTYVKLPSGVVVAITGGPFWNNGGVRRKISSRLSASGKSPGAKAFGHHLLSRSSDAGKAVYERQSGIAEHLGRTERTVRNYLAELEGEFFCVERSPVYRQADCHAPAGGWGSRRDAFRRRHVNRYCPVVHLADYPQFDAAAEALEERVAELVRAGVPIDEWPVLEWPSKAKRRKDAREPAPAAPVAVSLVPPRQDDTAPVEGDTGPPATVSAQVAALKSLLPSPRSASLRRAMQ